MSPDGKASSVMSGCKVTNKHRYVARAWIETSCNPIWSSAYSNRHGRVGSFLSKPKEENPGDQALMLCYEGFRVRRWSGSEVLTVRPILLLSLKIQKSDP